MASATISKSQLRRQLMTAVPGVAGTNLETPRDIFAVEEESTTHNATNGTHNAVNQQNGRSTTTAAARSRHPNGNANTPPPPTIITIDATLKTKIEALLIKKTHELDHDLINGAINQVIGNGNSLLRAAMKIGWWFSRHCHFPSITRLLLIASWTSNSPHETGSENSETQCCNHDVSC
jgi:hypothetical protein